MKGVYPFSLYCECGTTVQFAALPTDTATAALMEQVLAVHRGHERVTPDECRAIRAMAPSSPAGARRVHA